jgi:hypothetical protein
MSLCSGNFIDIFQFDFGRNLDRGLFCYLNLPSDLFLFDMTKLTIEIKSNTKKGKPDVQTFLKLAVHILYKWNRFITTVFMQIYIL